VPEEILYDNPRAIVLDPGHQKSEKSHQVVMEPEHYRSFQKRPVLQEKSSSFLPKLKTDVQIRCLKMYESLAAGGVLNG